MQRRDGPRRLRDHDDDDDDVFVQAGSGGSGSGSDRDGTQAQSLLHAPIARMSDICAALSVTDTTVSADQSAVLCDACGGRPPSPAGLGPTCHCAPAGPSTRRSSSGSIDCRSLGLPGVDSQVTIIIIIIIIEREFIYQVHIHMLVAWHSGRTSVSGKLFTPIVPLFTKQRNW